MQSSQNGGSNISDDVKKQLSEMNSKLDRLVSAIENLSLPKSATSKTKEVSKETKSPAKKVVAKTGAKKTIVKNKK